MKRNPCVVYLGRRVGSCPNVAVKWMSDGKNLQVMAWSASGSSDEFMLDAPTARLLVKRLQQALKS